ncbi:hypothetical protein AAFQ46_000619 [Yersinia enterocolitica]|nr:hypothetical protein [Yersinia enterocolitica]HDL7857824.1 hypothetical protein [Yersinia enterocolitica]
MTTVMPCWCGLIPEITPQNMAICADCNDGPIDLTDWNKEKIEFYRNLRDKVATNIYTGIIAANPKAINDEFLKKASETAFAAADTFIRARNSN